MYIYTLHMYRVGDIRALHHDYNGETRGAEQ